MREKRLRLADTHDLFASWYAGKDKEHSGDSWQRYKKHVEEFAITLEKNQYCCACGERMRIGDRAYRSLVTWGDAMSEQALRPHHTFRCIPAYEFVFKLNSGEEYSFSTFALSKYFRETIEEPNARTDYEAIEWAAYAGRVFNDNTSGWQSYTIKRNGTPMLEIKADGYIDNRPRPVGGQHDGK